MNSENNPLQNKGTPAAGETDRGSGNTIYNYSTSCSYSQQAMPDATALQTAEIGFISSIHDRNPGTIQLQEALASIKNCQYQGTVNQVRAALGNQGKAAANEIKKSLPGFLFSGTFTTRGAAGLKNYSGLISVDIDAVEGSVDALKQKITNECPYILTAFVSPSGNGLKLIIPVAGTVDEHLLYFLFLETYFKERFNLTIDKACKDVSRICFASADSKMFINWSAQILELTADEKAKLRSQQKVSKVAKRSGHKSKVPAAPQLTTDEARELGLKLQLPSGVLSICLTPAAEGTRSERFHRAVRLLSELGCMEDEINKLLSANNSFVEKYYGRMLQEVRRITEKYTEAEYVPEPIKKRATYCTYTIKKAQ